MEFVKPEHMDLDADADVDADPRPSLLQRLLSWRLSTRDRALDKDPMLWMHRDVTA